MLRTKLTNIFATQESLVNKALALHKCLRSKAVIPQDIPKTVLQLGSVYQKINEHDRAVLAADYQDFLAERAVYAADIKQYLLDMKSDIATTPWDDAMPAFVRKINFELEDLHKDQEVTPERLLNSYHKIIQLFQHASASQLNDEAYSFFKQHRGEIDSIHFLPFERVINASLSK